MRVVLLGGNIVFSFKSIVRYSEIDIRRQMKLSSILELLQDCCILHSEEIGVGIEFLETHHRAWVLSAWQVVVNRYPQMGETIKACTWPYAFKGFMGNRNFTLEDAKGEVIAYANSIWAYLDTETGRPTRIPQELMEHYQLEKPYAMDYGERKIQKVSNMKRMIPVQVGRFHIDTNQHVNNSKYVMMAEEYLPRHFKVREIRVEYKKAAVFGDIIYPEVFADAHQVQVAFGNEFGDIYAMIEFMEDAR